MMTSRTRWVLRHRRLITVVRVAVTLLGIATVDESTVSFSKKFTVPRREDFTTNSRILALYPGAGRILRWSPW